MSNELTGQPQQTLSESADTSTYLELIHISSSRKYLNTQMNNTDKRKRIEEIIAASSAEVRYAWGGGGVAPAGGAGGKSLPLPTPTSPPSPAAIRHMQRTIVTICTRMASTTFPQLPKGNQPSLDAARSRRFHQLAKKYYAARSARELIPRLHADYRAGVSELLEAEIVELQRQLNQIIQQYNRDTDAQSF